MRAPGHPQGCFLTEILMDELADRVKMDPVAFRVKNLPPAAPNAMWARVLRARREGVRLGQAACDRRSDAGPDQDRHGRVGAPLGRRRPRIAARTCDITSDGGVVIKCGTQDIGTGTRTIVAIVAAETLGLPVSAVKPEIGDSTLPFSGGSGGSTTAASAMPAIRVDVGRWRATRCSRRSRRRSASTPETLVAEGGRISVKGTPSKGCRWKDACKLIGTEPISVDGQWEDGLSGSGTSGVQFAEASVDIETGIVRVTRILAIQDCGLIVDKLTAESQAYGGVIARDQLRAVRGSHPRSRHRPDGQPEHGDVPARRHVRRAEDRHHAEQHAGARRDRHRRAADRVDRLGDRQRGAQRHRRDDPQPAAAPAQGAGGDRAGESGRHELKAFAYVNPANEKEAVAALKTDGIAMPIGGGQDLLARMKDYVDSPDRVVNVKGARRRRSRRRPTAA